MDECGLFRGLFRLGCDRAGAWVGEGRGRVGQGRAGRGAHLCCTCRFKADFTKSTGTQANGNQSTTTAVVEHGQKSVFTPVCQIAVCQDYLQTVFYPQGRKGGRARRRASPEGGGGGGGITVFFFFVVCLPGTTAVSYRIIRRKIYFN